MKKILAFLLALTFLFSSAALALEMDVSTLTVDELKQLKTNINDRLIALGELYEEIGGKSEGENVLLLQQRLIELGYLAEASGKWDKASMAAMKDWEKVTGQKQLNGVASIAEQEAIFAASAIPKPTPEPTATPKPTATPDPWKAYGKLDFAKLERNPENFIGVQVKITGRVVQVMGARDAGYTIRLSTKGRYDNVIMLDVPPEAVPGSNILDDDKITVYATLAGEYTYESISGTEITVPLAMGDRIIIN